MSAANAQQSTFEKLEFDVVRGAVADLCACGLGKKLALGMSPSTKPQVVRQWLEQVRELRGVAERYAMPPFGGVHDIREEVRACGFPTPLEPESFTRVGETLDATATLCAWFALLDDSTPQLQAIGTRVGNFGELARTINDAVDPRGHVRDYASERLASIRATIAQTRAHIGEVFDRLLRHSSLRGMLQYHGATFHGDRMVLPLKAEYRGRIPGIIHRSSDSGATLFVEPSESVELNNTIIRLREDEQREITRILIELCRKVHRSAEPILDTLRALALLDLVAAKCRYATRRSCTCPEVDESGVLDLHDARHPVLLEYFERQLAEGKPERQVVPIDVRLGDDFDVLMVTGPNTGGKTVAIKTIGLITVMAQCGLPIPVGEGSRVSVFHQVFVDIGDEQSLQQSLSTFSSHLSNQLDILARSGPYSLVLIDELGAGTDPDEGAAIGHAVVGELLRLRAKAVITTHLSALKAIAFTERRVDNACVEFDAESLRPTYRLHLGEPGNSNALIIARRLGMPQRLVDLAKGRLDERHRILDRAIAGTLHSRREAERARREAREATLDARKREEEFEQQRARLNEQQAAFARWTEWINHLRPGDDVFLRSMKRPARVVRMQLQKQVAVVSTGMYDLEVPLVDLGCPGDETPAPVTG
jgi:DNA mismatch repair protein MutS2